jgi:hypothetical protein
MVQDIEAVEEKRAVHLQREMQEPKDNPHLQALPTRARMRPIFWPSKTSTHRAAIYRPGETRLRGEG